MLSKKSKIHGRPAIQRVFEKGRKLRVYGVTLFSLRFLNKKTQGVRISVITPTSLKLSAVKRNRLRRRVYEAIRKNFSFTKGKNCDIVVVVKKPLAEVPFAQISAELINLFEKLP